MITTHRERRATVQHRMTQWSQRKGEELQYLVPKDKGDCGGGKRAIAGAGAGACAFASGTGSPSAIAKSPRLIYQVFIASPYYTRVSGAHDER